MNIYYHPEEFSLKVLMSYDFNDDYGFNIICLWQHDDGRLFMGQDAGCSCPSPFEDHSFEDLTQVSSLTEMSSFVASRGHAVMPISFTEKAFELGLPIR